jgi:hypothetical protein
MDIRNLTPIEIKEWLDYYIGIYGWDYVSKILKLDKYVKKAIRDKGNERG